MLTIKICLTRNHVINVYSKVSRARTTDLMSVCRAAISSVSLLASFNMASRSSFMRRQHSAADIQQTYNTFTMTFLQQRKKLSKPLANTRSPGKRPTFTMYTWEITHFHLGNNPLLQCTPKK